MAFASGHLAGRGRERSLSWPSPIHVATTPYKGDLGPMSATETNQPSDGFYGDDDFDEYPDRIFSSPVKMYEYDDWASDSDDDEEVEWDAGITDFALFDYDRRKAHDKDEPLPERWSGVVQNQASALERSIHRYRADSAQSQHKRAMNNAEDMPGLTPDQSPELKDDFEENSYQDEMIPSRHKQMYFTEERSPSNQQRDVETQHDRRPMKFLTPSLRQRAQSSSPSIRRQQRPGLSHSRTMSGHIHSWKRPDRKMYTVGEDPYAESVEDECTIRRIDSGTGVGHGKARR